MDLRILYGSVTDDAPALAELLESLLEEDSADFAPVALLDDITVPLPPEDQPRITARKSARGRRDDN